MTTTYITEEEARNHILEIQKSYTERRDRVLDSLSGAMWIVEKMFARSGHFLLEFIQNAEDAKATKVKVVLEPKLVKIFNNGIPFSRDDVEAICSIGRSRKDPREYVGYLGVGFKAVFLVSSKPHIYSKPYRFKFDRDHWDDPRQVPWQITPIWLNEKPEELKEWNVIFHIPLDEEGYERVKGELERLAPTTLLFLHNISEIELKFEDKPKIFRKVEEAAGICRLDVIENDRKETSRWVIFRNIIKVPEHIKADKFTREWNRDRVEKREIAVAFKLDESGDLTSTRGTVKFGVFSYVPLREEELGLPFLIHADFLVAPGREVVQREAPWNIWMLEELAKFIINSVINSFKLHNIWKYSYTNVLYCEVYHAPFDTHLANPISKEIREGNHLVDIRGKFIKASEAVKVNEGVLKLLNVDFIEKITGKKVLHLKTKPSSKLEVENVMYVRELEKYLRDLGRVRYVFGDDWIENLRTYLNALANEWFRYAESTREKSDYKYKYQWATILIDEAGNRCSFEEICIPVSEEVEQRAKELFPGRFKFLHPKLREDAIIRFLKELGINILDKGELDRLIKKEQIPKLLNELKDPEVVDERKVEIVKMIKQFWEEGIISSDEISRQGFLIKTKSGKWLKPEEVLPSSEYEPDIDIERLVRNGLLDLDLEFLDPVFIHGVAQEEKARWLEFLKELKLGHEVKSKEERLAERVGILVALRYEREVCRVWDAQPISESERGRGYDIRSRMPDGSPKYIEVKASKGEWSITLTKTEYRFILDNPSSTFVYVIANALKDPELHIIPGSSLKDMIPEITLTTSDWKSKTQKRWKPLS